MSWSLFIQLLVTAIVAFTGAWLAHTLAAARDRINKRREQRIAFLIEAYRRIESAVNRPSDSSAAAALESAVADIQLFGNRRQIKLVQSFITEFAQRQAAATDDLLNELRRDLRAELGFDSVSDRLKFLRISFKAKPQPERSG